MGQFAIPLATTVGSQLVGRGMQALMGPETQNMAAQPAADPNAGARNAQMQLLQAMIAQLQQQAAAPPPPAGSPAPRPAA